MQGHALSVVKFNGFLRTDFAIATASVIFEITLNYSGYFYVHIEDIGYEHFNYGIFVCFEVLLNLFHCLFWVVRLLRSEALLDFILFCLHFLLEYLLLGLLVLVDFLLSQLLD